MPRRTRVLVITPDYPPSRGGIQLLMHRLVSHWNELQPLVVTRRHSRGGRGELALLTARAVAVVQVFPPAVVLSGPCAVSPAAQAIRRTTGAPYVQYLYGR